MLESGTHPNPFVWKWSYTSQTSDGTTYTNGRESQRGFGWEKLASGSTLYNNTLPNKKCDASCTEVRGRGDLRADA